MTSTRPTTCLHLMSSSFHTDSVHQTSQQIPKPDRRSCAGRERARCATHAAWVETDARRGNVSEPAQDFGLASPTPGSRPRDGEEARPPPRLRRTSPNVAPLLGEETRPSRTPSTTGPLLRRAGGRKRNVSPSSEARRADALGGVPRRGEGGLRPTSQRPARKTPSPAPPDLPQRRSAPGGGNENSHLGCFTTPHPSAPSRFPQSVTHVPARASPMSPVHTPRDPPSTGEETTRFSLQRGP
jgi:hypothetical protein